MASNPELYAKIKAELDTEYAKKLAQAKVLCEIADDGKLPLIFHSAKKTEKPINPGEYGALSQAVKKTILEIPGNFTATKLWEKVKEIYPTALRPSVSTVLMKLVDDEEIRIIEEGRGNKPTIFSK